MVPRFLLLSVAFFPLFLAAGTPPRDGTERTYYDDGSPQRIARYRGGRLHGHLVEYWPHWKRKLEAKYDEGVLDGLYRTFYSDGHIEMEGIFREGKLEGLVKRYFENGRPREFAVYLHGETRQVGEYRAYYRNGKLKEVARYRGGMLVGTRVEYRESGDLVREPAAVN